MGAQTKTAEPTVVNGINVDDLFALIDNVKREPAKGKTNWHVTTTWQGQARSRAEIESYEIGGGKERGPRSIYIDRPRRSGGARTVRDSQDPTNAARHTLECVRYTWA